MMLSLTVVLSSVQIDNSKSDSEFFWLEAIKFAEIPLFDALTMGSNNLYSLIISVFIRLGFNKGGFIILQFFIFCSGISYTLLKFCRKNNININLYFLFLIFLATNFTFSLWSFALLREAFILLFIFRYLLLIQQKRVAILDTFILTIFHGGFIVLFIFELLKWISAEKKILKIIAKAFLLLMFIVFFFKNVDSIYKISFRAIEEGGWEYVSNNISGTISSSRNLEYRTNVNSISIGTSVRSIFYFYFRPYPWTIEAISSPVNFYKFLLSSYLVFLIVFSNSNKVKLVPLLLTSAVFALATSQFGQAWRHHAKFVTPAIIYILVSSVSAGRKSSFLMIGILLNILFLLLFLLSLVV